MEITKPEKIWRQEEVRVCRELERRTASRSATENSERPW